MTPDVQPATRSRNVDARDVGPPPIDAGDTAFWASLASFAAGAFPIAPAATIAAVALSLVALRRFVRQRSSAVGLIVAAFLVGAVRSSADLRAARQSYERTLEVLPSPSRCVGEGRVTSSPLLRGGTAQIEVELERGECDGRALVTPLRARLHDAPNGLARGDRVSVAATLAPLHLFRNEGTGEAYAAIARSRVSASGGAEDVSVIERGSGVRHAVDLARAEVRDRIEATYHPDARPLARALVLGETDLAAEDDAAFRVTGLSHLLAVSGTHLVIAILGLAAALRALLVRMPFVAERIVVDRAVSLVAIPVGWLYADFAGGSGSVVRAAWMLSAALAARAMGRRASTGRTLAFTLFAQCAVDPLAILDCSFSLSFAATLGLLCLARPFSRALGAEPREGAGLARRVSAGLARALGTTLGASVACAPLIASMAPTLPAVGVAANLLAAPLGEVVALPLCFLHALFVAIPGLERGAALIASGALLGVLAIARAGAATGLALSVPTPTPWQLSTLAAGFVAIALSRGRVRASLAGATVAAVVMLELSARRAGAPAHHLRVSALDVGQGDSILVDLPDGQVMLIDGGGFVGSPVDPGARVVLPALRARRRTRVDVAVLSHPHPDHFTGLATALDAIDVGEVWDTGESELRGGGPEPLRRMLANVRRRGIPLRRPADLCGAPREVGGAEIRVLAPCPGPRDERGANDNSFVIHIAFGERSALFTGDAEQEEETGLLALDHAWLAADLLKVGHHGSRTSTSPALLDAVAPRDAIISSGVRNRFGHPHPSTLAKLRARDIHVLRTDRGGEWRWETDGESVEISRAVADPI